MIDDGLQESSVDIPIAALNQTPAKHSGPVGRLDLLKNMSVEHYTPTDGGPQKLRFDPRGAFISLSTDGRNPVTGAAVTPDWSNPELLSGPLSICNSIPRVFNGEDAFITYADQKVVTNKLSETVFHTSDRTIQAQDDAWTSGVTCSVWAERKTPSTTSVALFIGMRAENGTWIKTPQVLYDPEDTDDNLLTMARVVADDDGVHFWVVHNCLVSSTDRFRVHLFNVNGEHVSSNESRAKNWGEEPGYWDISKKFGGGVIIWQPIEADRISGDGIVMTQYTQTAGVISVLSGVDTSVHCRGPIAVATNDLDIAYYLLTVGDAEDAGGKLWGYRFNQPTPSAHVHEYNFNVAIPGEDFPDSLIGYVEFDTNPDATGPKLYASYTVLPLEAQTSGPAHDPALRYSQVYSCDTADNVTFVRQNNCTCQVSRAFKLNGQYYAITYYQSGSGLVQAETQIEAEITSGDYMIGQRDQPIKVEVRDETLGSTKTVATQVGGITITLPLAPQNIDDTGTPDKVEYAHASGLIGIPDGTLLLKWTFKNLTNVPVTNGGRLRIASSSIPTADGDWDFLLSTSLSGAGSHEFWTLTSSAAGGSVAPGNFSGSGGSGGTAQIVSMTDYGCPEMNQVYYPQTQKFLNGGQAVVTGSDAGGADGTFTIAEAFANDIFPGTTYRAGFRVYTTTQTSGGFSSATCVLTPNPDQNQWVFLHPVFSDVLVDVGPHKLIVANSAFDVNGNLADNDGEYSFIDVIAPGVAQTDGSEITAQIFGLFGAALPDISIHVPLDIDEFTFKIQSLTLDYSFNNALVFVQNSPIADNNGLYRISFVDPANGTFIAKPADGRTGQRSESFDPDGVTVTIFITDSIQPIFQPKWFITPIHDTQTAQVGRFEDGLAFADWRYEGAADPFSVNNFPLHVASVVNVTNALQVVLPYRARSFTAGQPLVAPPDQVADASIAVFESTVGIKSFRLSLNKNGQPSPSGNALFLPGPLTGVYTGSGFHEQGINVAPECPFVVSQSTISDDFHQTPNTKHQVVVTFEITDESGDRVFSVPSPPMECILTGTNNSAVYGGRLPCPLDSDGKAIAKRFGVTNYRVVGITIERTAYQGDIPTIQHYKITDDLNVNGIAPVSDLNGSGFSFPDEFTWNYIDNNPDTNILTSEVLYTDKGFLPRFPMPPSSFGCIWQQRPWRVFYDGSLGFGGDAAEGDAPWYFPGFRYTFGNDKAVSCAPMGPYLVVGCESSIWYIPQPNSFPDAAGRNGTLPNPVELTKIKSGCTGFMLPVDGGVAYSSTVGGLWMITQNFQNIYLSRDIQNQLSKATNEVTSMVIDANSRMHVATGTNQLFTYDQIVGTWYNWELPTATGKLLTVIGEQVAYQDNDRILVYDPAQFVDNVDDEESPILWRLLFATFSFGGVRRFSHCWAFQFVGEYLGPHRLFGKIGYPDDKWQSTTTRGPLIPDPTEAYLAELNPDYEEASTYTLELYNDFEGVENPGRSAAIECVAAAVGLESGMSQTLRRLE